MSCGVGRPRCFTHFYLARFRRACPGGSDNWRATPGRYRTPSPRICGSPSGLSRRERQLAGYARTLPNTFPEDLRLSVGPVPAGSRLCKLRACQLNRCSRRDRPDGERDILLSLGSQPVVIPPGQARRKSHGLVRNNEVGRPAHSEVSHYQRKSLLRETFGRMSLRGRETSLLYTFLSCSLPSGLSRRERQLAGYARTLPNTFPEDLRLSVGPVPAGSRLCKLRACQLNRGSRRDKPDGERDILLALVANQL